ncbi:3-dehydroquinate synthase [Campylobacter sp. RM12920]|uniref:3-dehydroquinate synthase n=1 Tax=Campylobacter californiensis TaxID=1032243 RepID=A0ABD4JHN7_9BACT|nr:3-dehydroquinate synthase [Campylobacter sp. RM12919]MBE2988113.1 3-dehydroquinate synthase [Campylobacter sp. RM12920]
MQIDLRLKQKEHDYKVYINELERIELKGKVAIVTNPKVAGLHLKRLLDVLKCDDYFIVTVPDGEEYKNLTTVESILEQLFTSRLDRSSTLIAFGGGVISDMVGFVASIYQRGIKFINIPTTLLSQVDASVGGKTGVNNKFGKNLIGSFYQPEAVYCESKFLQTLAKREFSAGVAEAIKMAVTFDKEMFEWLENADLNDEKNLANLIYKAVGIKANVVMDDEKEKSVRAVLNYGHTFAHVIENQTNYKTYLHGEAVAIGINMANALALHLGLMSKEEVERVKRLLLKFDLPTSYKINDEELFYDAFFLDKKSENSKIKFILADGIGNAVIKDNISKSDVLKVLREFK